MPSIEGLRTADRTNPELIEEPVAQAETEER
jgi:hypothetical protein